MGADGARYPVEQPKFFGGQSKFTFVSCMHCCRLSDIAKTTVVPFQNEKVVGVVGFMDRRLELPEGLDPQVASIIRDCWKRYTLE